MLYEHEHWIYYINCVTLYGQGAESSERRKTIFWCGAPSSSNSGPYMHEKRSVGGRGGWDWACECKMTQACMHGTHLRDVAEPRIGQGQGAVRGQAGGTRAGSAGDWNLIIVVRREVGRVQGARSGGPESGGEVRSMDGWMVADRWKIRCGLGRDQRAVRHACPAWRAARGAILLTLRRNPSRGFGSARRPLRVRLR